MNSVVETTGVVKKGMVALPDRVRPPDGTKVRVIWEAPAAKPYERESLTSEEVRADLDWATGKRFAG